MFKERWTIISTSNSKVCILCITDDFEMAEAIVAIVNIFDEDWDTFLVEGDFLNV